VPWTESFPDGDSTALQSVYTYLMSWDMRARSAGSHFTLQIRDN